MPTKRIKKIQLITMTSNQRQSYAHLILNDPGKIDLSQAYMDWTYAGAVCGGAYAGLKRLIAFSDYRWKDDTIDSESILERGIRGVWYASQVGFDAGIGAISGGIAAFTAPISMPLYAYLIRKNEQKKKQATLEADKTVKKSSGKQSRRARRLARMDKEMNLYMP